MSQPKTVSLSLMLMGILFCVCLIASNLFETKMIQIGPLSLTGGLIVFPVSYIINDCIAEVWGFRKARLIIWMGFLMNFFVAGLGKLVVWLPAAPYWTGEQHFDFVFGLVPRIAFASLTAFLVGSFLNAWVMSRMKIMHKGKYFSLRAIVSTLVGETGDSLIFFPVAFAGIVPPLEILKLMAIQIVLKTLYEVIILPVTVRVVGYIKKIEETDIYDDAVSYNVFRIWNV